MVGFMDPLPWEIHPDLTSERLEFLARLIHSVRTDAVDAHDPEKGDTAWGLGCRAHERTLFAIVNAAAGIASGWLRVIEPGLHFVFAIGAVPVRFYRGEAEHPPAKSLRRNYPEIQAAQTSFSLPGFTTPASEETAVEYLWRIAIETDVEGAVDRVVLIEVADDGATRTVYEIPKSNVRYVATTERKRREGKQLPPPRVGLKSKKTDTEAGEYRKKADEDGED